MGKTTHLKHIVDDEFRQRMTKEIEGAARLLLEREIWRTHWSVEIDGCVFKVKVEGYPKWGTERYKQRERELALMREEFEKDGKF